MRGLGVLYLIAACEQVRDYDRAGQWCERVSEFCQRHGIALLLSVCKAKYAGVLTWQGRWDEADVELKLAVDGLVATRPAMVGDALVRLGDLRRRQGRLDEAEELFRRCEGSPMAILDRAEIALDRGAAQVAAELADRYLLRFPDRNRIERCAGLEVAVRAHLRLHAPERAEAALTELRDLADAVAASRPLRAAALTAQGRVAAARGDLDAARSLNYVTPLAGIAVDVLGPIEQLLDAYRRGTGVPFEAYGDDLVDAIGAINRPQFLHQLGDWLASIPEIHERLQATPPARVADVAAGTAQSSLAIARAYPLATIDAIDIDATSIARARANVAAAGLDDRVRPVQRDAEAATLGGPYDLVTIFEALHDMNHPVAALRAARNSLTDTGRVLIADERVAERFNPPGDEVERLNYGFSVLHCLAVGLLDPDSAGTGTVIRPDTVRRYATEAGFRRVDVLPIEHDFWRFYRLTP